MPLLRLLLVGLLAVLLGAPVAALGQDAPFGIGTITDNLQASGVAIDPDADVTDAQVTRFRRAADHLRAEGVPADIVVLGRQALGAATFAEELHRARDYEGIQVVIVQDPRDISFSAPSVYSFEDGHRRLVEVATGILPRDPVRAAETLALQGWNYSQDEADRYASDSGGSDDDDVGVARWLGRILAPVIIVLVVVLAIRRRGKRQGQRAGGRSRGSRTPPEPAAVNPREALDDLLDDLANRITDLAPDVDRPDAPEAARRAYTDAVLAFGEARDALAKADSTRRARAVQNDILRGLEAAEAARRIVDGDPPAAGGGSRGS
ncbi:MAG: hypothetical protein QOD86_2312 [Miltoncostaeaceae bacterium]|nr:hypothetical protein [Miltoncostaeaceae bacterium]